MACLCALEVTLGVEQGQLVMELCSGGSLATLIHNFGPLGDPSAAWLSRCIVRALKYLHQHGISHMVPLPLRSSRCSLRF